MELEKFKHWGRHTPGVEANTTWQSEISQVFLKEKVSDDDLCYLPWITTVQEIEVSKKEYDYIFREENMSPRWQEKESEEKCAATQPRTVAYKLPSALEIIRSEMQRFDLYDL
jgi:hypothetical protein